jgi:glutathione synthase
MKETCSPSKIQHIFFSINRSDYMLHSRDAAGNLIVNPHYLQIENNTVAASFACLSRKVSQMHRFLTQRYLGDKLGYNEADIPLNDNENGLTDAMAHAVDLYNQQQCLDAFSQNTSAVKHEIKSSSTSTPTSTASVPSLTCSNSLPQVSTPSLALQNSYSHLCTLMVVQPGEKNVGDQRLLEYALWHNHRIAMYRVTLADINDLTILDAKTNKLHYQNREVALVYFRAGYTPVDYPEQKQWDGLIKAETSLAIKCPNIQIHLAGTKKVQQHLAKPGVLDQFMDADQCQKIKPFFAGLWSLDHDDDETKAIIQRALRDPDNFVLKPQREGGGNNFWGKDLVRVLGSATLKQRKAYILMERIFPQEHRNILMRGGAYAVENCVSELGLFGSFISSSADSSSCTSSYASSAESAKSDESARNDVIVHRNMCTGYLLRTKIQGSNEGGVATGWSVLDTPILY